jgi:hypothetical protein
MKRLAAAFSRAWRARFHHYVIDDPRPIAESAPYTFFLPSENELLAIQTGDLAKLIFRAVPPSPEWGAERMWVRVASISGDQLQGVLENVPWDMPQLQLGEIVAFCRSDIIDVQWAEERASPRPLHPHVANIGTAAWSTSVWWMTEFRSITSIVKHPILRPKATNIRIAAGASEGTIARSMTMKWMSATPNILRSERC